MESHLFELVSDASNGNNLTLSFSEPFKLDRDKRYMVAVTSASILNSWYNISAAIGNNTFRYYNGLAWKVVTLGDGQYNTNEVNEALHVTMRSNGDYTENANPDSSDDSYNINITPDYSRSRVYLDISGGYALDFSISTIYTFLGFTVADNNLTTSQWASNVSKTSLFLRLNLTCSLCSSTAFSNSRTTNSIVSIAPNAAPGKRLTIPEPGREPIYYLIKRGLDSISEITMKVVDENGDLIELNGERTAYTLHLKAAPLLY